MASIKALVHTMRFEADGVLSIEFRPANADSRFPPFSPGAHIDLHLPNGLVRSYSLCNSSTDRGRYVVGVLNDRNSRGGSRYVHQQLRVGQVIDISAPRNHFALHEDAERSVLVSGGIGVTPIFSMLQRLVALGRPVELVYCARNRQEAAFIDPIETLSDKTKITWHFDDHEGRPPALIELLADRGADSHYYCCGPAPMLDAFEKACGQLGYPHAHIERFAPAMLTPPPMANGFEVLCRKSGKSVEVPPGKSVLDALIDAGLSPDHSCKEGVCGACETPVLGVDGELDHRDGILAPAEREAGKTMMICVSRCTGRVLELDI
ncbi:PDR/VanB family oxidoreductase [Variovorax ureilyticus]|uniref:PDR/VanB family oxidoreductase n=1 Tax=Variovorax ureilyticus TaxID=1836198 RepID=A0ABU8VL61_9BURK